MDRRAISKMEKAAGELEFEFLIEWVGHKKQTWELGEKPAGNKYLLDKYWNTMKGKTFWSEEEMTILANGRDSEVFWSDYQTRNGSIFYSNNSQHT